MLQPDSQEKDRPSLGLVEDDPVMGRSLEQRLALEGYRVAWWRSGEAALGALAQRQPDAVICDIRLPDMSGEDLAHAVAELKQRPQIVLMSGEHNRLDRARPLAQRVIQKPFSLQELTSVLEASMQG